ncbi:proteasome regulatory particle base subunit [Entomortierella lignicola]|nr:proteasome regulatory particle base subunit [Entomortierella lignicola]
MSTISRVMRGIAIKALQCGSIPHHVGFIMDGNRRYGRKVHVGNGKGYYLGYETLEEILAVCMEMGVKVVTVYAFSIENFKRPPDQVETLMELAKLKLAELCEHSDLVNRYGIGIRVLGDDSLLPDDVRQVVRRAVDLTKKNNRAILNMCFPYTSREELAMATRSLVSGIEAQELNPSEYQYYKIKLSEPLAPGEKTQITIAASFSNSIRPFPTHIVQGERQFFLYFGNPFALTAYPATKQKTTVITPNSQLEVIEHPEEAELVIKNNQVILGPYNEVKALEHGIFEIQYQLTGAVPYVSHLRRDIEVSQWGNNLAVEEHYKFVNKGAELKGHFSRIDLQLNPMSARESNGIMALMSQIPKLATEIYYRDEIGNISTSTLVQQPDHIILTFRPRFPIFGGWNTTWYTGYNVPLDGYLRVAKSGKNILKVPVFVPLRFTTYGDIEVRVVLPEGSKNVNVHVPFEVEEIEHSNTKTYMDSAGRHTITIHAKNLIEEHAQDMLIEYELDAASYLTKPIAAAVMLMIIFATSIVYSRLDFRIGGSTFKK